MSSPAPFELTNTLVFSPALQGPPGVPGTSQGIAWTVVTSSMSPYQMNPIPPGGDAPITIAIAYDTRTGPGEILFYSSPQDGAVVVLADPFNLSSAGNTIMLGTQNPLADPDFEDPSNPGSYGVTGHIANPNGRGAKWKYSKQLNIWILW